MNNNINYFRNSDFIYTKCYCEENVYKFCEKLKSNAIDLSNHYVVWVSNPEERVTFFGHGVDGVVVWDYHVISIEKGNPSLLYDFDVNILPFPCNFNEYVNNVLMDPNLYFENLMPNRLFRVIPSNIYLNQFASDRSHMIKENKWLATPPPYPPIIQVNCKMNLHQFKNMDKSIPFIGTVMNQAEFINFFKNSN